MSETNAYTVEERDGRLVRVYESGLVKDDETGRIVQPPPHTLITADNTTALHRARLEKKREALMRGALNGTRAVLKRESAHELEWVEVLGEANMQRAADPKNVKGVDASRFLLQEAGLSERQADAEAVGDPLRDALASLFVEYARRFVAGEIVTRTED